MRRETVQALSRQSRIGASPSHPDAGERAEIAHFLAAFPPFTALTSDDLAALAARTEVRHYEAGENILVEDGEPAHHLYVVAQGSVELLHEDELVDVLEPGECFGHPSLLTGMAPAFTVRGHEADVACYLIASGDALGVLGRPAGAGYVAASLRERLTRTGHVVHALPETATVHVADLIPRAPVFCRRDDTIRAAAQAMTDSRRSAILVSGGAQLEILTDAALRRGVVARRR